MRTAPMLSPFPLPRPGVLLALLLAGTMTLGACGRRGRPEPPPQEKPAASQPAQAAKKKRVSVEPGPQGVVNDAAGAPGPVLATGPNTVDDEDDESNIEEPAVVSPQPIPQGRRKNPTYVVPKEPFLLDFLL